MFAAKVGSIADVAAPLIYFLLTQNGPLFF